jgi:4-hydroxybenzoate polyprenyltransferase
MRVLRREHTVSMISTLFKALRVYQWTKNLLVFVALVFAQQLHLPGQILRSMAAFLAFCAASSVMYLFNDAMDIENDRVHPEKCTRPLASGAMRVSTAVWMMALLLGISFGLSWLLGGLGFFLILLFYLVLTTLYSLVLKNVLFVDVLAISIGFVVRAMAGAIALHVTFSNWLVVCTMFLALFLAISKRRHEMRFLSHTAMNHREVLGHYTVPFLDTLNVLVAGATLITYTIYTCSLEVVERLRTDKLYLTLPFVVYGLFRYLYLVQHDQDGGDPGNTLLTDRPLGLTVLLWGLTCIALIYWRPLG